MILHALVANIFYSQTWGMSLAFWVFRHDLLWSWLVVMGMKMMIPKNGFENLSLITGRPFVGIDSKNEAPVSPMPTTCKPSKFIALLKDHGLVQASIPRSPPSNQVAPGRVNP